jgi:hypothetical protein
MMFKETKTHSDFFPSAIRSSLALEKMGLRFVDEKEFRTQGLKDLVQIYPSFNLQQKMTTFEYLREAARSSCALPTYCPLLDQTAPVFLVSGAKFSMTDLVKEISNQNLALPLFECDQWPDSLLEVYVGILATAYRGPLFLSSKVSVLTPEMQRLGILNSIPEKHCYLNNESLEACLDELKQLLWFRNQILPLTEPWMFNGFSV